MALVIWESFSLQWKTRILYVNGISEHNGKHYTTMIKDYPMENIDLCMKVIVMLKLSNGRMEKSSEAPLIIDLQKCLSKRGSVRH